VINPHAAVPTLIDQSQILTQSLAIIEYLNETHPEPPLLPKDSLSRAYVRALAQGIACDIHPINNRRVMLYLQKQLAADVKTQQQWSQHWIVLGFNALEKLLSTHASTGKCCYGDQPTLADICLVPQVFNAKRVGVDMGSYPLISRINDYCLTLSP